MERAELMLEQAEKIDSRAFVTARVRIVSGQSSSGTHHCAFVGCGAGTGETQSGICGKSFQQPSKYGPSNRGS